MGNDRERLELLFRKYLDNCLDREEYDELWRLLDADMPEKDSRELSAPLQLHWEKGGREAAGAAPSSLPQRMRQLIDTAGGKTVALPVKRRRWAAAAAILLLVSGSVLYYYRHTQWSSAAGTAINRSVERKDIAPGGNKALLTLSNGTSIVLDSAATGQISQQGNTRIMKTNGRLVYNSGGQPTAAVYNTLSTPRGGQYQLVLPDGSRVWLNAASSIRFPSAFTGGERAVEITGEAYFEVAEDASKPFLVKAGDMKIQVLGTDFNVRAYHHEAASATLLQGRVKVLRGAAALLLQPSQEARAAADGTLTLQRHADMEKVIAWKNGLFWFDNTDIQAVMQQLSLWYDADIDIRGHITQRFTGSIPRNVPVSAVLEVLQETGGLHYKIEDKKIIVSP